VKRCAKLLVVCVIQVIGTTTVLAERGTGISNIVIRGSDTLRAFVEAVTDQRSSAPGAEFWGGCLVRLRFDGGPITDETLLLRARMIAAVDSPGNDLLRTNRVEVTSLQEARARVMTLRLKKPAREATYIRIKGEVDLYAPTNVNGSLIVLENIPGNRDPSRLQHPTLKQHGIELLYLNGNTLSNMLYKAKKDQAPAFADLATVISQNLSNIFFSPQFSTNTVGFLVKDPQHVVALIELRKRDGGKFEKAGFNNWESFYLIHVGERVPADSQLRIHLALPETIISAPFHLEHIGLP